MSKRTSVLVVCLPVLLVIAGSDAQLAARPGTDDDSPPGTMLVKLRDACDPPTFNAVLGPGACVGQFRTTLAQFNAELTEDQVVGAWRFHPLQFAVEAGTPLMISNRGGETHTFTQVAKFGGGFVAALNQASGNLVPAPECASVVNGRLVPRPPSPTNLFVNAGDTVVGPALAEDDEIKFQCCIHPWMRTRVNSEDARHARHGRDH